MSNRGLIRAVLAVFLGQVFTSGCAQHGISSPLPDTRPATVTTSSSSQSLASTPSYPVAPCLTSKANIPPTALPWLKTNLIPLRTTSPGDPYEDLMPLRQLIGDARVVALGDESHGIHEFFQMKHRLIQFLIQEMGFNAIALETPWPEATLVNEYVRSGDGDPVQLLRGLGNWWSYSREMLDAVEWIHSYNNNQPDKPGVTFDGFDIPWANPRTGIGIVVDYLTKVDTAAAQSARNLYQCFLLHENYMLYRKSTEATKTQCIANLRQVVELLASGRAAYESLTSPAEYATALHSAEIVLEAGLFDFEPPIKVWSDRDRSMANQVSWLLGQAGPNSKIILWGHNAHVGTLTVGDYVSMGARLRSEYGKGYFVIGFGFYSGSLNAASIYNPYKVMLPPEDSYETLFHELGRPQFLLPLKSADQPTEVTNWLRGPHCTHSIGAAYDDTTPSRYFDPAFLPDWFDAFLYIDQVSPTNLLPMP